MSISSIFSGEEIKWNRVDIDSLDLKNPRLKELFEACANKAAGGDLGVLRLVDQGWRNLTWLVGKESQEMTTAQKVDTFKAENGEKLQAFDGLPLAALKDEIVIDAMAIAFASNRDFLYGAMCARAPYTSEREMRSIFTSYLDQLTFEQRVETFANFSTYDDEIGFYGRLWMLKVIGDIPVLLPKSEKFNRIRYEKMVHFIVNCFRLEVKEIAQDHPIDDGPVEIPHVEEKEVEPSLIDSLLALRNPMAHSLEGSIRTQARILLEQMERDNERRDEDKSNASSESGDEDHLDFDDVAIEPATSLALPEVVIEKHFLSPFPIGKPLELITFMLEAMPGGEIIYHTLFSAEESGIFETYVNHYIETTTAPFSTIEGLATKIRENCPEWSGLERALESRKCPECLALIEEMSAKHLTELYGRET